MTSYICTIAGLIAATRLIVRGRHCLLLMFAKPFRTIFLQPFGIITPASAGWANKQRVGLTVGLLADWLWFRVFPDTGEFRTARPQTDPLQSLRADYTFHTFTPGDDRFSADAFAMIFVIGVFAFRIRSS